MGSDASYDREHAHRRRHRDEELKELNVPDRANKRSHRDDRDSESYAKRDRPRSRERERDKPPRRRSRSPRSPKPRRHGSRDRHSDRKRRDSHDEWSTRKDRDRRRDDSGDESSSKKRRRRRSPSDEPEDEDDWRRRRKRDAEGAGPTEDQDKRVTVRREKGPLPSQADQFLVATGEEPEKPKEKPNFGTSGHLAAASNSIEQADGTKITLKYHEPPEARKPSSRDQWKLFVFKGKDIVDTIELSHRSCWLVGREMSVVDLAAEHPSISKQHAVIQFRYTEKRNEFGDKIGRVKPYLIDLESANGTKLNGEQAPDSRYLELRDKDMVQFGLSTREYVLMLAPRE